MKYQPFEMRRSKVLKYQSAVSWRSSINLDHRAASCWISASSSCGVLETGESPCASRLAFTSGSCMACAIPWVTLVITAEGVPAAVLRPIHSEESKPGTPDASTVGSSGSSEEGFSH